MMVGYRQRVEEYVEVQFAVVLAELIPAAKVHMCVLLVRLYERPMHHYH